MGCSDTFISILELHGAGHDLNFQVVRIALASLRHLTSSSASFKSARSIGLCERLILQMLRNIEDHAASASARAPSLPIELLPRFSHVMEYSPARRNWKSKRASPILQLDRSNELILSVHQYPYDIVNELAIAKRQTCRTRLCLSQRIHRACIVPCCQSLAHRLMYVHLHHQYGSH